VVAHDHAQFAEQSDLTTLQRIGRNKEFNAIVHERLHPRATLTTTGLSLTPDTRSGKDFVIVTTATS
jgi:hypothetical protein